MTVFLGALALTVVMAIIAMIRASLQDKDADNRESVGCAWFAIAVVVVLWKLLT